MKRDFILNGMRSSIVAVMVCCTTLVVSAFPTSKYTTHSRLSTGKWVKIAVPSNGVYELTTDELAQMGFSNINNVRIYGNGGHNMYEGLDGKAIDDLQQIPTLVTAGKLCFYGKGPVKFNMSSSRFTRTINPYSTHGYYFITEGGEDLTVSTISATNQPAGTEVIDKSYDFYYHESELFSFSSSGKDLLGEDITSGASIDFFLPQNAGTEINATIAAASKLISGSVTLTPTLQSTAGTFTPSSLTYGAINYANGTYYGNCTAIGTYATTQPVENGKLNVSFKINSGNVAQSKLDYFILTYHRNNIIAPGCNSQMAMAYNSLNSANRIVLPQASESTLVWNISDNGTPTNYELTPTENGLGFSVETLPSFSQWVAFDPQGTLKKISSYEHIENQNIHGMTTPQMVIITNKTFMEQAQRIADLHKMVDDMDVAVIDQEKIFNEFSSGTPNAMAYRLMCKMFYDRDKSRFKYLLLFGEASYDNRGLSSIKPNRILTYESDNSTSLSNSYVTDDFFGCLEDNTSPTITTCKLSIAVGRFPSANLSEAKKDVDKLVNYVLTPDYGAWRNNALMSAEYKSESYADMHHAQAEYIANLIETNLNTGFAVSKAYISMFPRAVNETAITKEEDRTSFEANRYFTDALKRGQFFATYIGHAGYRTFTNSGLWTTGHVLSTTYPHLPIFTTACCDVARFDSDQRGIAEHMFHMPGGGAIALLTATREVFSDSNHSLNKSWVNQMFNWRGFGHIPTLGEVYKAAKLGLSSSALNHFKFVLFGDPAMHLAYPLPLFNITEINGTSINADTEVSIQPLEQVNIKAQVMKADGSGIDTDFNGEATIIVYDKKRFFKEATDVQIKNDATSIYYPEEVLTQVQGQVVNGLFNGTAVLPRYTRAVNETGSIRIFAHKKGTDQMVNGVFTNLKIAQYNASTAITDNVAPVIESMFLNEESSFNDGAIVPANSTLYITASDNVAINNQAMSLGNNMRLTLDGGKSSYYLVNDYAVVSNEGHEMNLAFPLTNITPGQHTLSYTIHDMAGNATSRSISFIVGNVNQIELAVEELPAVNSATINVASSTMATTPQLNITVTDILGNLVWKGNTTSLPITWNLNDMTGKRVKGGVYKMWGNYETSNGFGGTNVTQIVVTDPLK